MPCVVVLICILVLSLWNIKNWPYPAVKYFKALVSIIIPISFIEVLMVIPIYLHTGIPWQDIVSLLFISPRISCLGQASFSKIYSNRGSQLVDTVVIFS